MRKILLIFFFSIVSLTNYFFFFTFPLLAQQVDTAWVRRYNGPGNGPDGAWALAVDDSDYVCVTGGSFGITSDEDYATIKYNHYGDQLWVQRYNGPGDTTDRAFAIAVDHSSNVYVTGYSFGISSGADYATVKYNPNGDQLWVQRYNGPGNGDDKAFAIDVDSGGNVYVTGYSWGIGTETDYATIKYYPNGDTAWVRRYNGPGNDYDHANALAVDISGNVYVTGASYSGTYETGLDAYTIKYYTNGDTAWVRRYDGPRNSYDAGNDIALDDSGNVLVVGETDSWDSYIDYLTIKYYSNGDTAWVRTYTGSGYDTDESFAIAVDDVGSVYVTGESFTPWELTSADYATIKYYSNGSLAWERRYEGPENSYDKAKDIAVDDSGSVYVTGSRYINGSEIDIATLKYRSNGDLCWLKIYSPGNPSAIAVNNSGDVYVTGSDGDYVTIKYGPPIPLPGVDLLVEFWGSGRARPGFYKSYLVCYENLRSDNAQNVVLTVKLPKEVQYISCNPSCNVNGQDVSWNLGTVQGGSIGSTSATFYIPPSVPAGTVLKGTARITTTSKDNNMRNNMSKEEEQVVNSGDPNDKEAQPWGGGIEKYVMPDQPLRYTIFFENDSSATAEAIYVDIVDTLDTNFDWSTLHIGPMSHPDTCEASFDPISGVLSWHCDSIMLPPNHNPPEGEGFVTFSVIPDSGLPFGTQIKNRAYIKFDYNPWVAAPDSGTVIRTIGKFGDANADGMLTVSDVIYLINYLFKGGPEPLGEVLVGDVNCDGQVTVSDVVYIINYLFKGGPPPVC